MHEPEHDERELDHGEQQQHDDQQRARRLQVVGGDLEDRDHREDERDAHVLLRARMRGVGSLRVHRGVGLPLVDTGPDLGLAHVSSPSGSSTRP